MVSNDEWLGRVVDTLKTPPSVSVDFDRRVLEAVRRPRSRWPMGWTVAGTLGLAAALALLVIPGRGRVGVPTAGASQVEFTIDLPAATMVAVVGDFNDWDGSKTPLQPVQGTSRWRATVPLRDGLYRYAFLIDGDRWVADPHQPSASDPDYGKTISLIAVE